MAHPGVLTLPGAVSRLAGIVLGLALAAAGPISTAAAEGPWRGQVLDAESRQPLDGVVVLAYWYRYRFHPVHLVVGHQAPEFFDAVETVTGAQGRWEIAKKSFPVFANIGGPFFQYYKPGYARWRYAGQDTAEWHQLPGAEQMRRAKEMALAVWTEEGGKVELLPARSREEQVKMEYPTLIPMARTPLSLGAINSARTAVGLSPIRPESLEPRP